jgi:hypothetical protein
MPKTVHKPGILARAAKGIGTEVDRDFAHKAGACPEGCRLFMWLEDLAAKAKIFFN